MYWDKISVKEKERPEYDKMMDYLREGDEKQRQKEESPRLIIPTGEESYLVRDIRPTEEITQEEWRLRQAESGKCKNFKY